ncbi:acetamidase/formamidase family protein [Belnapia sp. T6]|uniref:Acetamidase/formamidase family protein n=1 Tax=Belnapia mucosa TaxID=2804532 RepID=A0ABS1V557_9PROT|nr:acetamidase/formamidase family protein [Belnapia mucosa]MBL6456827.1 acetamidase/formamidase family protein [Belnapia mucosa]
MAHHQLRATPETVRVSAFDSRFPPVLTIAPGDTVSVECVSGREEVLPPPGSGMQVPEALAAIIAANPGMVAGHICTGPIAIEGAMPGDMLEIRIESIEPGADWGYNTIRPLAGTLPEDFHEPAMMVIPIDRAARTCRLPWGTELPLAPFFGVMGVAPPPAFGRISSKEPRIHGGNLDNKELVAGSTLFLPVFVPGANFSVGDGHGVQGDGEVCVTALETSLNGRFTFLLHKADGAPLLARPRAETPTHYISMGLHEDLDQAMKQALREMIAFITSRTNLSREQAYAFCSLAVDFRVTQTVNGEKGVHGMLKKGLLF